jgi:hypothetical protein
LSRYGGSHADHQVTGFGSGSALRYKLVEG